MGKNSNEELATAYHEAGHVIAYWHYKHDFKKVSIVPDEETLGKVTGGQHPKIFHPDYDDSLETLMKIAEVIVINLAGPIAEEMSTGKEDHLVDCGGYSDYDWAIQMAEYATSSSEETVAFANWLFVKAKDLITFHRATLVSLAKGLYEKKELNYEQVRKIFVKL